jgi:hypothetical protein
MKEGGNADETNWIFSLRMCLLSGFRWDTPVRSRIHWKSGYTEDPGWCGFHAGWDGHRDRCRTVAVVRISTQHHGAAMVQRAVDTNYSATGGAVYLRSVLKPCPDIAFLEVATDWRCHLVR